MQLYVCRAPSDPAAAMAIVPQNGSFVNTRAKKRFSTAVFHRLLITHRGNPQGKYGTVLIQFFNEKRAFRRKASKKPSDHGCDQRVFHRVLPI